MFAALMRAGSLGIDLARGQAKASARRLMRQAAVGGTMLFFVLLAFGFALAAFTVWLSRETGVIPALGLIALGFLILAGIVYGVAAMGDRPKRQRPRPPPPPIGEAMRQEFVAAEEEAPTGSTIGSMAVVAVVGYLLARQLFRR